MHGRNSTKSACKTFQCNLLATPLIPSLNQKSFYKQTVSRHLPSLSSSPPFNKKPWQASWWQKLFSLLRARLDASIPFIWESGNLLSLSYKKDAFSETSVKITTRNSFASTHLFLAWRKNGGEGEGKGGAWSGSWLQHFDELASSFPVPTAVFKMRIFGRKALEIVHLSSFSPFSAAERGWFLVQSHRFKIHVESSLCRERDIYKAVSYFKAIGDGFYT